MKKILCFRNSRLGDYLISIPSLKLIREKNKGSKIYYLSDRSDFYKSLPKNIEQDKIVDQFIFYKNNYFSFLKLFFFLRSIKFDKLYYLQEKPNLYRELRDFLFFYMLNIKKNYGFFFKQKDYKKLNETTQLSQRINLEIKKTKVQKLSKISKNFSKRLLDFQYLTISIGGFSQPMIWNNNNWAILLKLILNNYKSKIIILGTKKDISFANFLSMVNKKRVISLCGKTKLNELFNIIKFSDMHITNDNGSMHVATLYEKKTICLFNNHDPEGKWYPINKNAFVLRDKNNVNNIKPNKVFQIFLRLI